MAMTKKTKTPGLKLVDGKESDVNTAAPTDTGPADAIDYAKLWVDPELGDAITTTAIHTVDIGKPKDFFRAVPDPAYRRRARIYVHKPEGSVGEETYIIDPCMHGKFDTEAQPCQLVTVIYRDGTPRIWPIKLPKEGMKDCEAWVSSRRAAKASFDKWIKLTWVRNTYRFRDAERGYAPDPDWSKLPPFDDLIKLAFGVSGVIRDERHPIYRSEVIGAAPIVDLDDDGDDSDGAA
jgi:hypothetical protein